MPDTDKSNIEDPAEMGETYQADSDQPMMEQPMMDVASAINKETNKLDLRRFLIKVQGGRQYLPVQARILAFRHDHPTFCIRTEFLEINRVDKYAVCRCEISDDHGRLLSTGTKQEDIKGFGDYIEKSETGSIGRALNVLGYGTEYATDMDEVTAPQADRGQGRYVDSPRGGNNQSYNTQGGDRIRQNGGNYAQRPSGPSYGAARGQNGPSRNAPGRNQAEDRGDAENELPNARTTRDGTPQDERTPAHERQDAPATKSPEVRAVQAVQIKIREQRERIWGKADKETDVLYRDWLERQIGERSLKDAPIEVSRKALKMLEQLVENDPWDERLIEDQSQADTPKKERQMAA